MGIENFDLQTFFKLFGNEFMLRGVESDEVSTSFNVFCRLINLSLLLLA